MLMLDEKFRQLFECGNQRLGRTDSFGGAKPRACIAQMRTQIGARG